MHIAVIFDMDGTLVATTEADFLAWQRVFRDCGKKLTYTDYFPLLGKKSTDVILEGLGLEGDASRELLHRKMKYFEEVVAERGLELMPSVKELLADLRAKDVPLALATSSRRKKMELVMEESGLKKYFDVFVTGEEVHHGKPHPEIFLLAAKRLAIDPAHCLVLEDAKNGVISAKAAGMKCIAVTHTHPAADLGAADMVIDKFSSISAETILALFGVVNR